MALGLLMAIAVSMLTTVSFAWLTLSANPEVSSVDTSIASNGNLEIALATGTTDNYAPPGESQVGDSGINTTWGNLINLGSGDYGLENIVLRPALLNRSDLNASPLHGPVYDETGRVEDMETSFGFARWNSEWSMFESTKDLGVRAITSMDLGDSGPTRQLYLELSEAADANARYVNQYHALAFNSEYMAALASMMTGYMVENVLKPNNPSLADKVEDSDLLNSDLAQLAKMYEEAVDCFKSQAAVYARLLNLQATVMKKEISISGEEILAMEFSDPKTYKDANVSEEEKYKAYKALRAKGFLTCEDSTDPVITKKLGFVEEIDQFLADYKTLQDDLVRINALVAQNKSWKWSKSPKMEDGTTNIIDDIIKNLVEVKSCTISGGDTKDLKIERVGVSAALALADASSEKVPCETKITNGILWRMDNRSGGRIRNDDPLKMTVTATMVLSVTKTIYSNVSTNATDNYFRNESSFVEALIRQEGEPIYIAKDSYGFAVDFWVRTNAAASYLTLQGNVLTETKTVEVKGKDANGEEVQLYTIAVKQENPDSTGEGGALEDALSTVSYDVYPVFEEGATEEEKAELEKVERWCFADNHTEVTNESLGLAADAEMPKPSKKMEEIEYVIGFEGDNRVWEGNKHSGLSINSTTQGSGSCYVFYPETPIDQDRSLEMLKSMRVAFVNESGELLATAKMDTEHHYATTGKVIVPLVLDETESILIGKDDKNNNRYAITSLQQNVATRITALVYLDGTLLTNNDVLANADIEGHLNIQFGSSVALYPLDNEQLYQAELYAEVDSVAPTTFDYDTLTDGQKMTTNVKVRITGTQPDEVQARFIRRLNATQGTPEAYFSLSDENEDGVWEGSFDFDYPGEYILRSVMMDGNEKDFLLGENEEYPVVTVKGFTIASVDYGGMPGEIMSDASSYSTNVTLRFASNDPKKMPKTLQGVFTSEGAVVNVNFTYNPTQGYWQGKADFVSSGTYTMDMVIMDGKFTPLSAAQQKEVKMTLGMRVELETISTTYMVLDEDKGYEKSLIMRAKVLDNSGNSIGRLAGARLYYSAGAGTPPLETDLTWNNSRGYYEGEFATTAGLWKFDRVEIPNGMNDQGDTLYNTIRVANADAPVFTLIPPDPPSYVRSGGETRQYLAADADAAALSVTLKDAGAATVFAKFIKVDDNGNPVAGVNPIYRQAVDPVDTSETIDGVAVSYTTYTVNLDVGGLWRMEEISIFNALDKNQVNHPLPEGGVTDEESFKKGIRFNAETTKNEENKYQPLTVAVLKASMVTNISFTNQAAGDTLVDSTRGVLTLGKDANGNLTKTLLAEQKLSAGAIKVRINDTENLIGRGYFNVSDVAFAYEHGSNVSEDGTTYGGYTDSRFPAGTELALMSFTKDSGSNTNFTLAANDVNYQYATRYLPNKLTFKVMEADPGKETITIDDQAKLSEDYKAFDLEVWSKRPTVKVTGVNPGVGTTFTVNTGASKTNPQGYAQTEGVSNSLSAYEAIVYIKDDGEALWGATHSYTLPKVKLTLSDMPSSFTNAKAFFPNEANAEYDKTYTFTPSALTQENSIGGTKSYWGNVPIYAAGKQTVTKITVQVNSSLSLDVELSHPVTILESYSHQAVTFKISDSTYTGSQPATIQLNAPLGKHTITMPSQNYEWTYTTETNKDDEFVQVGEATTRTVYTERSQRGSGWDFLSKYYYYTPYTETTTVYKASSQKTTTTYVKKVTGWKLNGVTYAPGATVEVTGPVTITAVIQTTSTPVTVNTIRTKTVVTYGNPGAEVGGTKNRQYQDLLITSTDRKETITSEEV